MAQPLARGGHVRVLGGASGSGERAERGVRQAALARVRGRRRRRHGLARGRAVGLGGLAAGGLARRYFGLAEQRRERSFAHARAL